MKIVITIIGCIATLVILAALTHGFGSVPNIWWILIAVLAIVATPLHLFFGMLNIAMLNKKADYIELCEKAGITPEAKFLYAPGSKSTKVNGVAIGLISLFVVYIASMLFLGWPEKQAAIYDPFDGKARVMNKIGGDSDGDVKIVEEKTVPKTATMVISSNNITYENLSEGVTYRLPLELDTINFSINIRGAGTRRYGPKYGTKFVGITEYHSYEWFDARRGGGLEEEPRDTNKVVRIPLEPILGGN